MPDLIFRARARLLSVLGDQLIRDEVVALIELVKNAYDADAKHVTVEMAEVMGAPEKAMISIRDDGVGMKPETVSDSWMELATSGKTTSEIIDADAGESKVEPRLSLGGRIQLGEKGVGRLAAMKLGKSIKLVTRAVDADKETEILWDVAQFERARYLEDLRVPVFVREPDVFVGADHGTLIVITKIRQIWTKANLEKLILALKRLASADLKGFSIRFVCPELKIDDTLNPLELSGAPYAIEGSVDERGKFNGTMKIMNYLGPKPLELKSELVIDLVEEANKTSPRKAAKPLPILQPTRVGPFELVLRAYDLDPAGLRQAGLGSAEREALKEMSGFSIFRDSFRIFPYGERGDDWLELNQRRVNNPTLRLSNNQIAGFVHITRNGNPNLRDKTNREGLIENDAYRELKLLLIGLISKLEEERFNVRPRRKLRLRVDKVAIAMEEARKVASDDAEVLKALDKALKEYGSVAEAMEHRNEILLQVAGIGMAAERVTHELDRDLRLISSNLNALVAHVRVGAGLAVINPILESLLGHVAEMKEIVELLQPLQTAKRPRSYEQDVGQLLQSIVRLFSVDITETGIRVKVEESRDLKVECTRAELMQIFMNILDNAIFWLATVNDRRLNLRIDGERREVSIRDSGPGIRKDIEDAIFEPFFTTKEEGRGLGLYIVEDIMMRHGWSVELLPSDEEYSGAHFLLVFEHREKEVGSNDR